MTIYLSKYDDVIERRKIDEEIDLLTGLVKHKDANRNLEYVQNNSFLQAHNEELKFEMLALRNQPIQSNMSS